MTRYFVIEHFFICLQSTCPFGHEVTNTWIFNDLSEARKFYTVLRLHHMNNDVDNEVYLAEEVEGYAP